MNQATIITLITSVSSLIGAFVLWRKSRPEIKKLKTETFRQEIETIRETYSQMLHDQVKSVVEPMERRIDRLNKWVEHLNKEVDLLNDQVNKLRRFQSLFEIAVKYIRSLCHWIDSISPQSKNKPKLPIELRDYFKDGEAPNAEKTKA